MTSKNENNWRVYNFIKPLHKVGRFLQIWPYKYVNNEIVTSGISRCLSIPTLMILIICFGYSTIGKILNDQASSSSTITDIIFTLPLYAFVLFSIVFANFKQRESTLTFFREIQKIDTIHIFSEIPYENLRKNLFRRLIIINFCTTIVICLDIYFYVNMVGFEVVFFLSQYVCYYFAIIILLQICSKSDLLKEYFGIINLKLQNISKTSSTKSLGRDVLNIPTNIRNLCKIHLRLSDLVDNVNKIHGFQSAMLLCCLLSLMLLSLNFGLWASISNQFAYPELRTIIIVVKFSSVLIFFGPAVMMTQSCSAAAEECQNLGSVAHNLLVNIEVGTANRNDHLIQEELNLLIQQVGQRNANFSAGGFFNIDYSVIYGLIGAVTSYFIVLLQFKV